MSDDAAKVEALWIRNAMDAHADYKGAALAFLELLAGDEPGSLDTARLRRLAQSASDPRALPALNVWLEARQHWRDCARLARLPV